MNKEQTKKYPKIEIHKKDSILRLHKISGFGTNLKRQKKFEGDIKYISE